MSPKVSVLIPVYNASSFLRETINSVLSQTFSDFELILLNDCSQDNSEQIISEFDDDRIRYYKNERNLGIAPTRNKLIDFSNGEYLAVLDNDDIMKSDRLEKQVRYLDEHQEVSVVGSYFELFDSKQKNFFRRFALLFGLVWCHPKFPTLEDALKGMVLTLSTSMMRKKDLIENRIRYNGDYSPAEDYDLLKQALFKGLKLANMPEVLTFYNLHGDNCSIKQKDQMAASTNKIQQEISVFLRKPFKKYPRWKLIVKKMRLRFFI